MKLGKFVLVVMALAMIHSSAKAQTIESLTGQSSHDLFRLWTVCMPVGLSVEDLGEGAAKIGLRERDIETAVRSRLRGARIYEAEASYELYARVSVVDRAYSIDMEFLKMVKDLSGKVGYATTWNTGALGTHNNNPNHILGSVAKFADHFIDEYLRVNGKACK